MMILGVLACYRTDDSLSFILEIQLFEITKEQPAALITCAHRLSLVRGARRTPYVRRRVFHDISDDLHDRA